MLEHVDFYLASLLILLLSVRILSVHTSNKSNLALLFIPVRHGNYMLDSKLTYK